MAIDMGIQQVRHISSSNEIKACCVVWDDFHLACQCNNLFSEMHLE